MKARDIINLPVLVLNQNYEPLNVCRARRAIVLIYAGKAEMLENGTGFVHTTGNVFEVPSVIRLPYLVRRPRPQRKMTRYEIFYRDHYTCHYCGKETRQLTLDHVVPRHQGGQHTWENVVSACVPCNRRKAGKTPSEAGMKLISKPARPHDNRPFYLPPHYLETRGEWQKYFLG